MKSKIILVGLMFVSFFGISQDATIYDDDDYDGNSYNLNIGQTITITSGQGLSVSINNSDAAIKVEQAFDPSSCTESGEYPENYFYTEIDQPFVGGTDQYTGQLLKISCIEEYLPQPKIFIPLDKNNLHPDISQAPINQDENDKTLMLRKANFWENSEDLCGLHGPYGELQISVCSTSVMQYSYEELVNNENLWQDPNVRIDWINIPGVAYDADMWPLPEDPRNEWIDNWWGAYYSNSAVWDWDDHSLKTVAIIISEADATNETDVLGRAVIDSSWNGCILIKCRMFGWVVLENFFIPPSGEETSVDIADHYLYLGWDGNQIENYYGLNSDEQGTQYNPFQTIEQVESEVSNDIIGILGDGKIGPGNDLLEPMTYRPAAPTLCSTYSHIIDWNTGFPVNREQNSEYFDPKIFPNPVTNKINVELNPQKDIKGTIKIYDIVGNLVKSLLIYSDKISIEVSDLDSGVYFLNFETGQNRYIKKIVKL